MDEWNKIPKKVIDSKTINIFKSQLNNHWKNLDIQFSPDIYQPGDENKLLRRVQGLNSPYSRPQLKKIGPSGGRREHFWGISCEKTRFYAKKSYSFQLRREVRKILGYFV
jgi:hypothetical protein